MRRVLFVLVCCLLVPAAASGAVRPSQFATPSGTPYDSMNRNEYTRENERISTRLAEIDTLRREYGIRIAAARKSLIQADTRRDRARESAEIQTRRTTASQALFKTAEDAMVKEREAAAGAVRNQQLAADSSVRWAHRIRNGFLILIIGATIGVAVLLWRVRWRHVTYRHAGIIAAIAVVELGIIVGGNALDDPSPPRALSPQTAQLAQLAVKPTAHPVPLVRERRRRLTVSQGRQRRVVRAYAKTRTDYRTASKRLTSVIDAREQLVSKTGDNRDRRQALQLVDKELRQRGK